MGYRDLLGWLDPSRKIVISTPGFHVATINPINSAQGVTAVEIRIPHLSESYYLEVRDFMDQWDYRNLFSFSADVMSDNSEGIMVYRTLTQTGRTTYLLDMSPTANYADYVEDIYNSGPGVADIRDVVLKEGMVYSSADVNLYNVSPGPDMNSLLSVSLSSPPAKPEVSDPAVIRINNIRAELRSKYTDTIQLIQARTDEPV